MPAYLQAMFLCRYKHCHILRICSSFSLLSFAFCFAHVYMARLFILSAMPWLAYMLLAYMLHVYMHVGYKHKTHTTHKH